MEPSEIKSQLEKVFAEIVVVGSRMSSSEFFHKVAAEKWSAAEQVQHLSLTYVPFNTMLPRPRLMLRQWGASGRCSRDPQTFQSDYKNATAGTQWKTFPPFVPMREGESADYLELHASDSSDRIQEFYALSGGDMTKLRTESAVNDATTQRDILDEFETRSTALLAAISKLTQDQLESCQLPLPYIGLVTALEGLYFTNSHTQHHLQSIRSIHSS